MIEQPLHLIQIVFAEFRFLALRFVLETFAQMLTTSARLVAGNKGKGEFSFRSVTIFTPLDSVGIIVGEDLTLLARIKSKHLTLALTLCLLLS